MPYSKWSIWLMMRRRVEAGYIEGDTGRRARLVTHRRGSTAGHRPAGGTRLPGGRVPEVADGRGRVPAGCPDLPARALDLHRTPGAAGRRPPAVHLSAGLRGRV